MRRAAAVDTYAPWLLALAVVLVYAPTFTAPVFGDDRIFVESAASFVLPFGAFLRALFSRDYLGLTGEGTYQPLVTLFHYATHGHPVAYRAFGAAFHAVNAWLVYRVARKLEASPESSLLAGLLFALFPTHAETLIISSFKGNLLAFGFTLASLLFWARAVETGSLPAVLMTGGFFLLALLSKETGLLVPLVLAGWSALFARRERLDFQRRAGLGFALVAVLYLWWRFRGLDTGAMPPAASSPSTLFGWYALKTVWPFELCRERLAPVSPAWHAGTALFLLAAWSARRRPAVLFGLLVAAVGVLPFIDRARYYMDSPVADRYLYMSAAGAALAATFATRRREAAGALAVLALAFGVVTLRRNLLYRDTRALYEQTVSCAPEHFKAWGVLSGEQFDRGDMAAAQASSLHAVTLNPYYPGALRVLRQSSLALGDTARAKATETMERALFAPDPQR